jgi:glycosyltransferase involved in cell wall biosynthesis
VHGFRAMAEELISQRIPGAKVHVVPHGTEIVEAPSRDEARDSLGIPRSARMLLYFGFVHPQKGAHTLLLAMRRIAGELPGSLLCIAGGVRTRTLFNRAYWSWLRSLARRPSLRGRVLVRPGFADPVVARLLFRAADMVLLPYRQSYGSASGVVHQAVGAGCLPLCSRSPKFTEIADDVDPALIVPAQASCDWADAVVRLLADDEARVRLTEKTRGYARRTAWPVIGARHAAIYRALCRRPALGSTLSCSPYLGVRG